MTKRKYNKHLYLFILFAVFFCISAAGCVSAEDIGNNTTNSTNTTGLADSARPTYQNNNNHTGQSEYVGPQNNTIQWTQNITVDQSSSVIGSDGTIYIGGTIDGQGAIIALNPNGTILWTYITKSIYSTPTIGSDGTIYVVNGQSNSILFALTPNGKQKWTYTLTGTGKGISIGSDGTLYVGTSKGYLYAITDNKTSATLKWVYHNSGVDYYSNVPAIGSNDTIYIVNNGVLYAMTDNGTNPIIKWTYTTNSVLYSTPSIGKDGTIYIGNNNGILYAIMDNGTSATLKWSYNTGRGIYGAPAIGSDGTIYIINSDQSTIATLYAIKDNGTTPTIKWSYDVEKCSNGIAAGIGADGTIYFGTQSSFYAIKDDGDHGTLKWSYITGNIVSSPAIGSDGTLYIGSRLGTFYAFHDLVGNFTANSVSGNDSLTVQFTDTSNNNPTFWSWDFGDENTSDEQNPTHTYNQPGKYTVTLTIATAYGDTTSVTKTGYITVIDTIIPTVTANVTTGTYNTTQTVSLTSNDNTATIYYTLDGSTPTNTSNQYTNPITIDKTKTLKYAAVDTNGNWSPINTQTYTIDTIVPTVTANVTTGTYNTTQTVSLTSDDNTATIYYTLDGSTPTTSSNQYTGPIPINTTTTLKYVIIDPAGNQSPINTQTYTIDTTIPTVTANITTGTFNTAQSVSLSSDDSTATIYYTLDGSTPTTSSNQYTSPIPINTTTTLKYVIIDPAGNQSPINTQTYTIDTTIPTVTANVTTGTYNTTQTVSLTSDDNTATIYYTTDGTTPTASNTKYTDPINIKGTSTLKFIAVDTAGNWSPVQSETYTIPSDVYVNVTASKSNPEVGDVVTYTFKLGNNGPGTATNVVFTYQIPEGMEYVGATKDTGTINYDPATRTITWTLNEVPEGDPWLWLNLRVSNAGTYTLHPNISVSGYPGLSSNIGSLLVNALPATTGNTDQSNTNSGSNTNSPASVNAAITTTTSGGNSVPMQNTGVPLTGLVSAILLFVGGLALTRKK